jgi:chemotaxis protein MotA
MGLSVIAGLGIAIGLIVYAIVSGGPIQDFVDIQSIMIVIGGTIGALMVNYPGKEFKLAGKALGKVLTYKKPNMNEILKKIIEMSYTSKKNGILALEAVAEEIDNAFLKRGIMLIVDGTPSDATRSILELEIDLSVQQDENEQGFMKTGGKMAPAFGMIGTLIGLIKMLKDLSDVSSVGPNMSVALITTFYGSFIANVVFVPLAGRLKYISDVDVVVKEMIVEGIVSIQMGESPYMIQEKLNKYIKDDEREKEVEQTT